MAAFSYEQLFDAAHSTPLFPQQAEMFNGPSCFFHYQKPHDSPDSSSATGNRSSPGSSTEPRGNYSNNAVEISEPLVISMEKKRKNSDGSCETCAQPKEDNKGRKQKKPSTAGGLKKAKGKEEMEAATEGYIHVKARRGQATDSHSLAERVRREKISERMKLLQALVPGCEKVTGKALMLDEIINYVQSLQNQVEFLSMKLASVNPNLYDFGEDFDEQINQLEKVGQDSQLSRLANQSSPLQDRACDAATRSYPSLQHTASPFLLNEQRPIAFSQYNGNLMMQGQGFLDSIDDQMLRASSLHR